VSDPFPYCPFSNRSGYAERMPALASYGSVPGARRDALAAFVADHVVTEQVLADLDADGLELDDVVYLDEYSLALRVDLGDGLWLVYDTT
jgi:hypothetical protein